MIAPRVAKSVGNSGRRCISPATRRSLREWLHDSQNGSARYSYRLPGAFSLQERARRSNFILSMCHSAEATDPQKPCVSPDYRRTAADGGPKCQLLAVPVDAGRVGNRSALPVLPLKRLDQVPERRAVLLDITQIPMALLTNYIDGDGIANDDADAGIIRSRESTDARLLYGRRLSEILR